MNLNESDLRTLIDTSNNAVVALFSAKWCGPCRIFGPIFTEVAQKLSGENSEKENIENIEKIDFAKMDVDECTQMCEDLNIGVVPTIIIFKDSKVLIRKEGSFPSGKAFEEFITGTLKPR